MAFNHENLKVYQRTLAFNARVNDWLGQWDHRHAVCDQLERAAGSMLENIAKTSAADSAMKIRNLEYGMGSALECAACLDLAGIKRLLHGGNVSAEKEELLGVFKMLVGLRRSWSSGAPLIREDSKGYGDQEKEGFHHEQLDVYRVALEIARGFANSEAVYQLSITLFRKLDEPLTSMILNIAEGNGRFSEGDQQRFIGIAHESAIKMAARLDLCMLRDAIPLDQGADWKTKLERVSAMTSAMSAHSYR
jgi:four helix bundle protein